MNDRSYASELVALDEIESLITSGGPYADPPRLARIRFLAAKLAIVPGCNLMANRLGSCAAEYFSARRHRAHANGPDALVHELRYSLVGGLRRAITSLARADSDGSYGQR